MTEREKKIREIIVQNHFVSKYRKKVFWSLSLIAIAIFAIISLTSLEVDLWKFFLSASVLCYLIAQMFAHFYVRNVLMCSESGVIHLVHLRASLRDLSTGLNADKNVLEELLTESPLDPSLSSERHKLERTNRKLERLNSELALFKTLD